MLKLLGLVLAPLALAGCSILPGGGEGSQRQTVASAPQIYAPAAAGRQCLSKLGADEANFTPLSDKYYGAGCSTLNTVRLSALYGDSSRLFGVSNLGPVACPLADTFAGWARYGVDRAARAVFKSPLSRIETMGSYSCRNVAGSERRSAHSTANAIDVSAFVLADGRRISVKNGWSGGSPAEQEFLRVIHTSACKRFGTVLGPGYNAAHQDHFHLEGSGKQFCH